MKQQRISGADIFRILCCVGVLDYHVVDDIIFSGSKISMFAYFAASFCVTGFFMLSGFLLAQREHVTLEYIEKKVFHVAGVLFGWVSFWCLIRFFRTGELLNIFTELVSGMAQYGILPVSWFLFTYVIVMVVFAYPLYVLMKKQKAVFCAVILIWLVAVSLGVGQEFFASRQQTLWLHIYGGAFAAGMLIALFKDVMVKIPSIPRVLSELIVFVGSSFVYYKSVSGAEEFIAPAGYYSKWYYLLWLVSLFLLCMEIRISSEKVLKIISRIADNTMVVYLAHLPILVFITEIRPIGSFREAVIIILGLFLFTMLMAELFRKLPLLRKLV